MSATPTAPAKKKRMPRAQREQRMLDAAEREFGRHGFAGASMETIAQGSGVTKALLYQYFESKEGLYEACVERARARIFEVMQQAARAADPARMLTTIVDAYFDQLEAEENSWCVLYGDAPVAAVNEMRNRNAGVIIELLREATTLAPRDAELVAHLIVGAGEQVGRWWLEHRDVPASRVKRKFTVVIGAAISAVEQSRP
ncbi:MAG TPA: TetR/AcrR family transcriptional regulator [Solirubrobacteraceae bacterium]|jgi:AcrR family transcriptional regulator